MGGLERTQVARHEDPDVTWFHDIDHLREVNLQVGWALESIQVEPGHLDFGVRLKPLGNGAAYLETTSRQVGVFGEPPDTGLTVAVPLANVLYVDGTCVEPGQLIVLPPGTDTRIHTGVVHAEREPKALVLHLDEDCVADAWRMHGDDHARPGVGARILGDTRGRIRRYGMQATRVGAGDDTEALGAFLAEELASLWTAADGARVNSRVRQRQHAVEQVWRHGLKNLDRAVPIEELCRVAGVSPRTLRRAFVGEFGAGPVAVLRAQRLNRAKQLLARGGLRVRDAAKTCGFNHFGRFSLLFKDQFGLSPSSLSPGR